MQAQIQALLVAGGGGAGGMERGTMGSNMESHVEVAKPAIFNGEIEKVGGFVTACRLYLRMKMRKATVEEQVFWVLLHVCYESRLKGLSQETTLVLSNTRELDRVPKTK